MENNLIKKYPPNWDKAFCEQVKRLKPEIQIALILYGKTGKI